MDRAVRKTRHGLAVLAVLAAVLASAPPVAAGQMVTPTDHCLEIVHFPPVPIGNSPSLGRIYATFSPAFTGGTLMVSLDGASGPVGGEGPIDQLGIGHAEFPLNDFGSHTFTGASIEMDGTSTAVDTTFFGDGGTFIVDANEPACDSGDLLLAPAPTTTSPPTTSPPTTSPPTTSPPTTVPPTTSPPTTIVDDTQVSTSEGGGFPWVVLLVIGIVLALGGGVMLAWLWPWETGKAFTDSSGQGWKYCSGGCKVKQGRTLTNVLQVKAIPKAAGCPGSCDCVLFARPRGGKAWIFQNNTGAWVIKKALWSYSARCVKKA